MSRRTGIVSLMLVGLLVGAVPAFAVAPPGEQLPDGDVRPVIRSVELLQPASHNVLLEADLLIEADDNDAICEWDGTDNILCTNKPLNVLIPVGGIMVPVSRLGLLIPWMGLAALAGLAALGVVVVRRRKGV